MKKKYHLKISPQATHKAINELVEEGVIAKDKKEYKLNIGWINNIEKFGKRLKEHYLKKEQAPHLEVGCGSSVEKDGFEAGKEAAEKAVSEIKFYKEFNLALAFISSEYEGKFEEILDGIYSVIGETGLIGCTGVGEIKDKKLYGSVVVTLIASKYIEAGISVIKDLSVCSNDYDKTIKDLLNDNKINNPDFGLILIPGVCEANNMTFSAPPIIDTLKKIIHERFPIIGANTSDDWKFKITYQFHNKNVYSNAVVLALIKTRLKFGICGKSAYKPINNNKYRIKVRNDCITHVADINEKIVYKPALNFYEKEIGITHREFKQVLPLFIKERISQNSLKPIGDIKDPINVYYPTKIIKKGIRFEYNFDDNIIIQIRGTTNNLLIKNMKDVINEALILNNIKKPKLILIFPCCIYEAFLSKMNIKEIELLKERGVLRDCRIAGTYAYGEVGLFDRQIKWGSGTVVCLVIGDEIRQ